MKAWKIVSNSIRFLIALTFLSGCKRCRYGWPYSDIKFGEAHALQNKSRIRVDTDTENKQYSITYHGVLDENDAKSHLTLGLVDGANNHFKVFYYSNKEVTWRLNGSVNNLAGAKFLSEDGERIEGNYDLYDGTVYLSYQECSEDIRKRMDDTENRFIDIDAAGIFSKSIRSPQSCYWTWKFWETD